MISNQEIELELRRPVVAAGDPQMTQINPCNLLEIDGFLLTAAGNLLSHVADDRKLELGVLVGFDRTQNKTANVD